MAPAAPTHLPPCNENGPLRGQVTLRWQHRGIWVTGFSLGRALLAAGGVGERGCILFSLDGGESSNFCWEDITKPQECGGAVAKQRRLGTIASLQPHLLRARVLSQVCWLVCSEWPLISCPLCLNWQQPRLRPVPEAGHPPRLPLPTLAWNSRR